MPMVFGISWSETPMHTRNSRPSQTRRCWKCELLGKTRSVVKKRRRPQKLAPTTIRSYVRCGPSSLLFGCSTSQHTRLFTQRPRRGILRSSPGLQLGVGTPRVRQHHQHDDQSEKHDEDRLVDRHGEGDYFRSVYEEVEAYEDV